MLNQYVDFHCHSILSDGRLDPVALLKEATPYVRYLALTDHNRLISASEMEEWSRVALGITLVPGAEMSAHYRPDGWDRSIEIHIVTLFYTPGHAPHLELLAQQSQNQDRKGYVSRILERLRTECGMSDVGTYDQLCAEFPGSGHIGRMCIAQHLLRKKYVKSVEEAFQRYLGSRGERRAYVENPIRYPTMEEVVRAAVLDHAIPVLAHLLYYDDLSDAELEQLVRRFKRAAGEYPAGLEVYYRRYCHEPVLIGRLEQLADRYRLYHSCGSDYHGQDETESLDNRFPVSIYDKLFTAHRNCYNAE